MNKEDMEKQLFLLIESCSDINAKMSIIDPSALIEFKGAVGEALKIFHNDIVKNENKYDKLLSKHNKLSHRFTELKTRVTLYGSAAGFITGIIASIVIVMMN